MRWTLFAVLLLFLGTVQMRLGPQVDLWGLRGEFFFLLAFHSAIHAPRRYHVPPAFWLCGLARDMFLGMHLGASTLLYTLAAIPVFILRRHVLKEHLLTRMGLVFALVFSLLLLRPLLEQQLLAGVFTAATLADSLRNAAFTALASPFFGMALEWPALAPWKEAPLDYGLSQR